jgi:hypothetical protein
MFSSAQRSASQYQVKMHSTATTRSSRKGATVSRNSLGSERMFLWSRTAPEMSMTHRYIVRACRSIPQ